MSQIRGTAGYHLGQPQRQFGAPPAYNATDDPSPLDAIRKQTSKIEDILDQYADPIKPWASHLLLPLHWICGFYKLFFCQCVWFTEELDE